MINSIEIAMMECSQKTWVEQTGFPDFEGTSFSVEKTLKDLTSEGNCGFILQAF